MYSLDLFKEFCNGANILYFCHFEDNERKYKIWFSTLKEAKRFANVLLDVGKTSVIYIRQYCVEDVVGEYVENINDITMHSFLKHYNIKGVDNYGC